MHSLDLLSTPTGVGLAHVARGLDGGDELENNVTDTDDTDDTTSDVVDDHASEEKAADEDVDWPRLAGGSLAGDSCDLQTPRPMKEKRNEAYRATCGGIWNSGHS